MDALEALRGEIPEAARDLKLNLQSVLESGSLTPEQTFTIAIAVAAAASAGEPRLLTALASRARQVAGEAVVEDGLAAASLMAMNNVYYRFRHQVGKAVYSDKPARLRMQRLAKPATSKAVFELACLAVSAINGCETCVKSHEAAVLAAGLSEEQVHDAVRVAAVVRGAATALVAGAALTQGAAAELATA